MSLRVLVTGGSGLLGSALVRQLCSTHDVVATYQTNERNLPFGCGRSVKIDLSYRESALQLFKDQKFDVVINAAGATSVDRCERDRDYVQKGNVDIVENLIAASATARFRLFQISSDYVFDGNDGPPTEHWKPNPINIYGTSKRLAEERIVESKMNAVILRVCALYSNSPSAKSNIAKLVARSLKSNEVYPAADDLFANPTEVNDLAEAIVKLIGIAELPQILHLAPAEYLSRYEFALKIAERLGADPKLISPVKIDDLDLPALRPKFAGLRSEIAAGLLKRELHGASEIIKNLPSI